MSASAPGASAPLRPAIPCTLAWLVESTATNRFSVIRPSRTPCVQSTNGRSVRDQREVVLAELLLAGVVERAVVGAEDVQVLALQPLPQRGPVRRVAQRRRQHVLGPLE